MNLLVGVILALSANGFTLNEHTVHYSNDSILPSITESPATKVIVEERIILPYSTKFMKMKGDIILGGIFPVHKQGKNEICHGLIDLHRGIQRVEAMRFAIDTINKDELLLPEIRLGSLIKDSCGSATLAQEQSLDFIRFAMDRISNNTNGNCNQNSSRNLPVAAVIGASYSSVSEQVADLLGLFKITQISPASTGSKLSDRRIFPYFARTVPPDTYQAEAMLDILIEMKWTYVHAIASNGAYGERGIAVFKEKAYERNVCLAEDITLSSQMSPRKYEKLVRRLCRPLANLLLIPKVIVLFTTIDDSKAILAAVASLKLKDRFIFVASDGWGKQQSLVRSVDHQKVALGAITIDLMSKTDKAFDEYFKRKRPDAKDDDNKWFADFWAQRFGCLPKDHIIPDFHYLPQCNESLNLLDGYTQDPKVPFVIKAVYSVAHAIHNMRERKCPSGSLCPEFWENLNGPEFYKELTHTKFYQSDGDLVQFTAKGDGLPIYTIYNYRRTRKGGLEYREVGEWSLDGKLQLTQKVALYQNPNNPTAIPPSICSEKCKINERMRVQSVSCCWFCDKCAPHEYLRDERNCEPCEEGFWPNDEFTGCKKLIPQTIKWSTPWALVPAALAAKGIILTLIVALVLIKYNDTPLVKASGRELCFMLLSGCILCYVTTLLLLASPTTIMCGAQRLLLGTSFSAIYAPLLTKTNRTYRIFCTAPRRSKSLTCISPESQIIISLILVGIQALATVLWIIIDPPGVREVTPTDARHLLILKCSIDEYSFVLSLAYNMVLVVLCTIYAVKTRNIPENFNEAKFIGFTMYTTVIIWLSSVPLYFGLKSDYRVQTSTLCVSVTLSATVALLCLFAPKVFIIVFHPEKNIRRPNTKLKSRSPTLTNRHENTQLAGGD